MYKQFYLMRKEPFDSHPTPELFYKSKAHQNGWNYLLQGIKTNEPFLLLTGDYGAGKTLLYLKLAKLIKKNSHLPSVYISTPTYNFTMMLEKILTELDLSVDETDRADESRLQQMIYEYFENKKKNGKKKIIYVVIDDAQEFSYSFINKLRLFASYNYSGFFPIKIILFAHPYFLKMLNYKKIAPFGQRIKRIYSITPLGFEETKEYIYFRLIYSGAAGKPVFDNEAIQYIQEISKGNPRLINNICDNCLLAAVNEKNNLISRSLVTHAMATGNLMGLKKPGEPKPAKATPASAPLPRPQAPSPPPMPQYKNARRKKAPASPAYNAPQRSEPKPQQKESTTQVQNRDSRSEKREKKKSIFANFGTNLKKKGIVLILILIILFLLFYLFNQNRSNNMHNQQGSNEKIIYSVPEHLYAVQNLEILKESETFTNSNSDNIKNRQDLEANFQPILLMGNLM